MKKFTQFINNKNLLREFNEGKGIPAADKMSFMNKLNDSLSEFLDDNYATFESRLDLDDVTLTVSSNNDEDLKIIIKLVDDKIRFNIFPTIGPSYEFNYSYNKDSLTKAHKMVTTAFKDDPNNGTLAKLKSKNIKKNIEHTSIDIDVIKDVLEDAYILNHIDLLKGDIDDLIRKMIKKRKKK